MSDDPITLSREEMMRRLTPLGIDEERIKGFCNKLDQLQCLYETGRQMLRERIPPKAAQKMLDSIHRIDSNPALYGDPFLRDLFPELFFNHDLTREQFETYLANREES